MKFTQNSFQEDQGHDLAMAELYFNQLNFPLSEIYARRAKAQGNTNADPLILKLCEVYGVTSSFRLCEQINGLHSSNNKYLLIKAWGFGFWSDVHHVVCQLFLAELLQRKPIVLWGKNSLFTTARHINSFEEFFKPISNVAIKDLSQHVEIYPPKWNWENILEENINKWEGNYSRISAQYFFGRSEELIVSDFYSPLSCIIPWISERSQYYGKDEDLLYEILFKKYIKPQSSIIADADSFFEKNMQDGEFIAVHARGSDKIHESMELEDINKNYYNFIDPILAANLQIRICLFTESNSLLENFSARYKDRLIATSVTRTSTTTGVHLSGADGIRLGKEVLTDTLIAIKCKYFLGNLESNVSLAVFSLGNWVAGSVKLLGSSSIRGENPFLHEISSRNENSSCSLCGSVINLHLINRSAEPASYYYFCVNCKSLQRNKVLQISRPADKSIQNKTIGSNEVRHFIRLQAMLPVIGIRKHDYCAHYEHEQIMFVGLMREIGYNYFGLKASENETNVLAYTEIPSKTSVKLLSILGGAENFQDVNKNWLAIFAHDPDFVIGSVSIYEGQGAEWLAQRSESGDSKLFYYSTAAIASVAARSKRYAYLLAGYFLLTRYPLSTQVIESLNLLLQNSQNLLTVQFVDWLDNPSKVRSSDNKRELLRQKNSDRDLKIAIDGTFFRFQSGISRLWRSLLFEWSTNGFGKFLIIIDRGNTAPKFDGLEYVDAPLHDYANRDDDKLMVQSICDKNGVSVFIPTYYSMPITTPVYLMVPDMIPEIMGFDLSSEQWIEKREAISLAKKYFCISESTATDLIKVFPSISRDDISITYCGTSFHTQSDYLLNKFKKKFNINKPYFMISGSKGDYKNAVLFFRAFSLYGIDREKYEIVCTNAMPDLEPEFAQHTEGVTVHCLVLSDEELQCAYTGAIALAYPSRYEGFGLPVLEAMACSCPVITCRNSSLHEVGGDAPIYVDPDDLHSMKSALDQVQIIGQRKKMIEAGILRAEKFSWRASADAIEDVLLKIF
jgi:glycosyltransferase involved in cell wall biosynthesis